MQVLKSYFKLAFFLRNLSYVKRATEQTGRSTTILKELCNGVESLRVINFKRPILRRVRVKPETRRGANLTERQNCDSNSKVECKGLAESNNRVILELINAEANFEPTWNKNTYPKIRISLEQKGLT